ncbi:MAG: hypothetical protein ACYDAJ_12285 [Nitrosotalea sp.]
MTGSGGVLVVDDTTLDKPYAAKMVHKGKCLHRIFQDARCSFAVD